MDSIDLTKIAAAIALLPLVGIGIGLGNFFSTLVSSMARNPSMKDELFIKGFVLAALIEILALISIGISVLILLGK